MVLFCTNCAKNCSTQNKVYGEIGCRQTDQKTIITWYHIQKAQEKGLSNGMERENDDNFLLNYRESASSSMGNTGGWKPVKISTTW